MVLFVNRVCAHTAYGRGLDKSRSYAALLIRWVVRSVSRPAPSNGQGMHTSPARRIVGSHRHVGSVCAVLCLRSCHALASRPAARAARHRAARGPCGCILAAVVRSELCVRTLSLTSCQALVSERLGTSRAPVMQL